MLDSTIYKIGDIIVQHKLIFCKMKHCFAMIPTHQLLDGHILIVPRRPVTQFAQLDPVEIFDTTLAVKLLSRAMESFYNCDSSTVHIQNSPEDGPLHHLLIHILPRKPNDLKTTQSLYRMLSSYHADFHKHYNDKMNVHVNVYSNKILQGLNDQARKYEAHVEICYGEEKEG